MNDRILQAHGAENAAGPWPADGANPWQPYGASITWRPYQRRALDVFEVCRREPGRRSFHLVAPPGAGKTLLGLAMAERLGVPTMVLSPNAAITEQWLARLRQHWVCLDDVVARFAPAPPCAAEPTLERVLLFSFTYQRLAVRGDGPDDAWHENVEALVTALRAAGVRAVIADECHHLGGHWGGAVAALLARLEDPFLIGLTATPVNGDAAPLLSRLGPPDHEISLPLVVRTGDLTPFQDLCHLVVPAPEENALLEGALARFEALFARVRQGGAARFGLDFWCDSMELDPHGTDGHPVRDIETLYRAEPDLVAALCRYRGEADREPPVALPYAPEFFEPSTLTDRLRLLAHYVAAGLARGRLDRALADEAIAVLATWGFDVAEGKVERRLGDLGRTLGYSRQKLAGMVEILRTEMRVMGDRLCALVLTDYEFPPPGRGLSCVDAMDLLTSTADVDELDPVMITGNSFLVDDDLWPRFIAEAERFLRLQERPCQLTRVRERGYWRVDAEGPAWNARTRVALATHLLQSGVSRCLVGTRALLGEGWDCERLNTLVDLTVIASPVGVNQIRGRSLRLDPADPVKVANNWDVLCLSPVGEAIDLERLARKHAHLYGVTDDGQVERGLGHVHGSFDRVGPAQLLDQAEAFTVAMHGRAQDRTGARARWRVGASCRDREFRVLTFGARARQRRAAAPATRAASQHTLLLVSQVSVRRAATVAARSLAAGLGALVAGGLGMGVHAAIPALGVIVAGTLGLVALRAVRALRPVDLDADLRSLADVALAVTCPDAGSAAAVTVRPRDDGSRRVVFENVDPEAAERAAVTLAELLGPVRRCRYLLLEPMAALSARWWQWPSHHGRHERVYALPSSLSARRDADRWVEIWRRLRNPDARVVHRMSEEGRALFARHLHRRPIEGEEALRTVWV